MGGTGRRTAEIQNHPGGILSSNQPGLHSKTLSQKIEWGSTSFPCLVQFVQVLYIACWSFWFYPVSFFALPNYQVNLRIISFYHIKCFLTLASSHLVFIPSLETLFKEYPWDVALSIVCLSSMSGALGVIPNTTWHLPAVPPSIQLWRQEDQEFEVT